MFDENIDTKTVNPENIDTKKAETKKVDKAEIKTPETTKVENTAVQAEQAQTEVKEDDPVIFGTLISRLDMPITVKYGNEEMRVSFRARIEKIHSINVHPNPDVDGRFCFGCYKRRFKTCFLFRSERF